MCFLLFTGVLAQSQAIDEIASSVEWQRRLFMVGGTSIIDDERFFLSPTGKSDARAELVATLAAFKSPKTDQEHPLCRFPSRRRFLERKLLESKLSFSELGIGEVDCSELYFYRKYATYSGISLVFSNYFVNNPPSMFGHSFFLLHRRGGIKSELLDDTLNYAATVPAEVDPLRYSIFGLTGLFKGNLSLMPYYSKIKEYSDYESRDLWQFKLNLTPEEIEDFVAVTYEIGKMASDYFFLDENCSYVLLKILEAVRPSLDLADRFRLYAIPADTIRAVAEVPGLVGEVTYLPASLSKFQQHAENLSAEELAEAKRLVAEQSSEPNCEGGCKAKILDALVQYADYQTQVVGADGDATTRKWRKELLLQRARLAVVSDSLVVRPRSSPPHLGHNSSLVGLGAGLRRFDGANSASGIVTWRPALHDLTAGASGYAPGMQLKVLETIASIDKRPRIESLTVLEVLSLPESVPLIRTRAWRFGLGYERSGEHGSYFQQFGAGKAWWFVPDRSAAYALLKSDLRFPTDLKKLTLGPALELGALTQIDDSVRVLLAGEGRRRFYLGGVEQDWLVRAAITYTISRIWDINCQAFADHDGYRTITLGARAYY